MFMYRWGEWRLCVLPAASICEPGKRALRYASKFGSSAWFCTRFRELAFTATCDPRKQLCLKGDTAVPSTVPWRWRGCPRVPQNCCNGKLCPSWHAHSLIFTYTSLVTALSNASTHPAGIIGFFPSNLSKAFKQPLRTSSCVCFYISVEIAQSPKSFDLGDETGSDRGIAERTDTCKPICRSATPWRSLGLTSSLQSCVSFHCAANHLSLWLLGLAIFPCKYKLRQGRQLFAHCSVVLVGWDIQNLNSSLQILRKRAV